MGIPASAKLVRHNDEPVTVEVIGDRKVRMENGEETFLTRATQIVLKTENGIAPTGRWRHEGRLLSEIYEETYGIKDVA